jgi:hypothetical protein
MLVPRASSIFFVVAALAAVGAVGAGAQEGVVYGAAYDSIRGAPLTGATDRMVIYRPVEASSLFGLGGASGVLAIYTKGN